MHVEPSFDTWTVLFLLAALHGFVVAYLLNKKSSGIIGANKMLALIILLFAASMMYYVAYWTQYAFKYTWLNHWFDGVPFLYGPLMYNYLLRFNEQPTKWRWMLHLMPFYVYTAFKLPFIIREIFGRPEWLKNYFFIPMADYLTPIIYSFIVLQCLSMLIYGFVICKYVFNEKNKLNQFAIEGERIKLMWLQQMALFYIIFTLALTTYWVLVFTQLLKIEYDYGISVIMTVFIYWVGYKGFNQPTVVNEIIVVQQQNEPEHNMVEKPLNVISPLKKELVKKYHKSSLTARDAEIGKQRLLKLMNEEGLWQNDNLKMQDVATKLELSTHHLSQILNELCGQSWADFITTYRIEHAKKLLADENYNGKVLAVAFDCGFNNKSTFNSAFKKHTGLSPSAFRERHLRRQTG